MLALPPSERKRYRLRKKGEINSQLPQSEKGRPPEARGRKKWLWDISKAKKNLRLRPWQGTCLVYAKPLKIKVNKKARRHNTPLISTIGKQTQVDLCESA